MGERERQAGNDTVRVKKENNDEKKLLPVEVSQWDYWKQMSMKSVSALEVKETNI